MHDIDRTQMELAHEGAYEAENFEFAQHEFNYGGGEVFSEAQEMELAHELLAINSEAELNHFLGKLIRSAGSAIGRAVSSPAGQAIGSMLKGVAKKALPIAGTALGAYVGGPLGAKIGGSLASMAANAFEMESMQQEDREFEGARSFVRLAGDAVQRALQANGGQAGEVAQAATLAAVRQHAPGLLQAGSAPAVANQGGASGRWVRRGNKIVIYGL
ncbi:hypothetical protein V8J88_19985 [Massilia sp. W12]|uniref:hypothetical protein n=1 Tax=Massilia sp. W12 TaxID=3126507 RepID=UPI0030CFF84B